MRRMTINRKQFLKSAVAMAGTGVGLAALAACGSDGNKGGTGGSPATGSGGGSGTGGGSGSGGSGSGTNACDSHEPMETIATNHAVGSQHILTVSAAEVTAGTEKTYSIKGMSAHDHMVTITAAMFTTLKAGTMIMTTSTSGGGHTHSVAVLCA
jgi:hypothetical protein